MTSGATNVEITPEQQARLEADGWVVTDVAGFLGMTAEESAVMEIRFALRQALKERHTSATPRDYTVLPISGRL